MSGEEMNEMTDTRQEKSTDVENSKLLEVCFVVVVGIIVIAAFAEAFSYELVSSRTPFVIMVPLILLLALQLARLLRVSSVASLVQHAGDAVRGNAVLRKFMRMIGWLGALFVTIIVAGHYVGLAGFIFVMIRLLAREKLRLALIVTASTTVVIFFVFELGFDIELYRGLIHRYFAGYRDF